MRVNLSVAIVAMLNSTVTTDNQTEPESCPFPDDYDPESNAYPNGEFNWDENTQGLILGSFYYGYFFTNIFGGRAAELWGGRLVMGMGVVLTAIFTILSPLAARTSTGLFVAVRILEGLAEGVTFPATNSLVAKWYPTNERSKFASSIFVGVQFGTVVTLPVSGWLCATNFLGGWPSVFYIFGGLGIVWGVFWFWLVRNEPQEHPRISDQELQYIKRGCPDSKEIQPVPWKLIFTSKYFWVISIMHFGNNWGFYTLLSELPTYLDQILHINIKNNGMLSALPYLGTWLFSFLFSFTSHRLLNRGHITILSIRRWAMIIGGYGPMLCLLALCFVNCHSYWAFAFLILSGTANGGVYSGYMCSHADISPRFAGTLMGLTNTIATIPGFLGPTVTGALTQDNQTLWAWRIVFIISALIYGSAVTIFLIFITTEIQPWNDLSSCNVDETGEEKEEINKRK